MRPLLPLLIAAALLALPRPTRSAEANDVRPPRRPNVILVLTDDQGYGDLSCHGNPVLKTPELDRLHGESIRLTDFHVAPMCTPTRGELMTGRFALDNAATSPCSGRTFMRREMATLADAFAAAGYRTGIFGKWHLGDNHPHRPMDRGFQRALYHLGWGITSTPTFWNNDYFDDTFRDQGVAKQFPGYCTDVWFEQARQWIEHRHAAGEPFFAYISTNAPHGPFWAPDRYKEPYADLDPATRGFFAMIANIDEHMGRLDALLDRLAMRENTLLIFMTDNGGTGGIKVYNAGMRGAKTSLYDGGHRVPCFIRWPKGNLRPPGDVDALTHGVDLMPTLADLCRLDHPACRTGAGHSLAPVLRGEPQPELDRRMLFIQYARLEPADPQPWDAAVLQGKWRLVKGRELYNVADDPGQEHDLAAEHPDRVARMRKAYSQWWSRVEPRLDEFERLTLGHQAENPTRLTSLDWLTNQLTPAAQGFDIRQLGVHVVEGSLPLGRPMPVMNGPWNVEVARAGQYAITLRRWPAEADAGITAPLPPYEGVDGGFPAGKAIAATEATIRIAGIQQRQPVEPDDKAVVFNLSLPKGPTQLTTAFLDHDGNELCGAFYVTIERMGK